MFGLDEEGLFAHDQRMVKGSYLGCSFVLLCATVGCQGDKLGCYSGYAFDDDGVCAPQVGSGLDDSGELRQAHEGEDAGSVGPEDTGAAPVLLGPCLVPETLPTDPIETLGFYNSIPEGGAPPAVLMELVQVQMDPARNMFWGVGQGGLFGFDVSDPATPELVARGPTSGGGRYYSLWVPGIDDPAPGLIYTTHRDIGLWVIDTTDLDAPQAVYLWGRSGLAGMDVSGDLMYIAKHSGELVTLDISDRAAPTERSTVSGMSSAWGVTVGDGALYGADNVEGVVVFDLSNPEYPNAVGAVDVGSGVQALALHGDVLFAAAGSTGVVALDVSDPLSPVWLDTWAAGESVQSVAVDGDTLWAVTQKAVIAFDVSDPSVITPVSSRETPFWAMGVDAADGVAWVGDWGAVRGYARRPGVSAPDMSLAVSSLFIPDTADVIEVPVNNQGSAPLHLVGLESGVEGLLVSVNKSTVAVGERAMLRLEWSGGELDTEVCLASDDPDQPIQYLRVQAGPVTDGVGVGAVAPDFVLADLDGEYHRLSEMIGHPVVLIYFATW